MRDVHARKRMFFARSARSCCQMIQLWEVCKSQACLQATSFLPAPAKIAVSQTNVVVESARTLIRLRAATVKRLLKESGSGASSSFDGDARSSTYTLRALVKVPK